MAKHIRLPEQELTHALVRDFAAGLQRVLAPGDIVGLYIGGSLASGDFDAETSDLDFLVVLSDEPTEGQVLALKTLHAEISQLAKNRLFANHECLYLSTAQTAEPRSGVVAPHLGCDGHFAVEEHGAELLIDLHKTRQHGFVVFGPQPEKVIGKIDEDTVRRARVALFHSWWLPKLQAREALDDEYQAYAALTMARILCSTASGADVSKQWAARWTAETYPQYGELVGRARAWRSGMSMDRLEEVHELIAFTRDVLAAGT